MTLGAKLKEARKQAGLSQEKLAEKLGVSRSAVAKWETDKGLPDIENLKIIAQLLNISIDYLLDENEKISLLETKEPINLDDYSKSGKARSKADEVVLSKYSDAEAIYKLFRKKKLNFVECVLDFIVAPGIFNVADSINDTSSYYLVEVSGKQFIVNVSKEFITSSELAKKITDKKFVIGKNKFTRAEYNLIG